MLNYVLDVLHPYSFHIHFFMLYNLHWTWQLPCCCSYAYCCLSLLNIIVFKQLQIIVSVNQSVSVCNLLINIQR